MNAFAYSILGALLMTAAIFSDAESKPLWIIAGTCAAGVATLCQILTEIRK